jgi:endoglucanase
MMFKAWELFGEKPKDIRLEIPEKGGALPDYPDELKWETDWVLKLQYPDGSGRISHKLTARNSRVFLLPEYDDSERYFAEKKA